MVFCCCEDIEFEDHPSDDSFPEVTLQPQDLKQAQDSLLKGVHFYKFCSNGSKIDKYLNLDRDRTRLTYTPSNKPVKDTTVYIKDIVEIREKLQGNEVPETKIFVKAQKETQGLSCFAIVSRHTATSGENRRRFKSFNLGFEDEITKNTYMQTISFLAMRTRRDYSRDPQAMRMLELWMEADKDADKRLSLKEISELLQKLNVQLDRQMLREKFNEADKDQSKYLNFEEFRHFYTQLTYRKEILPLFQRFAKQHANKQAGKSSEVMTGSELAEFLRTCQGEELDDDQSRALIQTIADPKAKAITLSQFTNYLFNKNMNSWWKPQHRLKVYQRMDYPLHHYWISSSHNTYLTGDQLKSRSSTEMYKIVLEKGCRCVELDCWDGADGEPIIYHGHTRTTKIRFDSVCKVINDYAFKTSEYPVILSLEVHCKLEGQKIMAKHLKHIMRDKDGQPRLVMLDDAYKRQTAEDPHADFTPRGLKNKILVKAKMHSDHYEKLSAGESDDDEKEESEDVQKERKRDPVPKHKTALELSACVFLRSTKMDRGSGPGDWAKRNRPHEIASYSESASATLGKVKVPGSNLDAFAEANKRMFSRIYPAGSRVFSDNYAPHHHWNLGCSIVALNWQKLDYPMRLNEARFEQNGRCGYVLKPRQFRQIGQKLEFNQRWELKVKVISGSQIPKPGLGGQGEIVDPYVALWIHGMPQDSTGNGTGSDVTRKTEPIQNNGFNPVWATSRDEFVFPITCPQMAMLTLRVIDADRTGRDHPIAEASIPVVSLRLGYRCVPLRAVLNNEPLEHACLFCHFNLTDLNDRGGR
eukprot:TRINITY_DN9_c0_g2_i1.p1 TRINITY_DN9_c0_g2~~TRINITY_DN9_c0_g2_i1.p1  ORF type:complete len:811 (+),score=298.47 TRINITY_DN9_c0_g2_i1:123-2555(+)